MDSLGDISLMVPEEHFDALTAVIEMGLQRAKISQEERKALSSWWEAEKAMMSEEILNRMSKDP